MLIRTADDKRAGSTTPAVSTKPTDPVISSTTGPFLGAYSYTWSQYILPTTVGTVMVVINEATNQTSTSTSYHTEFDRSGSKTILTRTDTNAAGTVTDVVEDMYGSSATM
jgi:hypothetical protein